MAGKGVNRLAEDQIKSFLTTLKYIQLCVDVDSRSLCGANTYTDHMIVVMRDRFGGMNLYFKCNSAICRNTKYLWF